MKIFAATRVIAKRPSFSGWLVTMITLRLIQSLYNETRGISLNLGAGLRLVSMLMLSV